MVDESGEKPDEDVDVDEIGLGDVVYDSNRNVLGEVRGFDSSGFYVTMRDGYEAMSVEHSRSGHEFGEAELMWRCSECGEMGEIEDGMPDECPNCGTPKEDIYYWTED
ncbi:hypothetical protein DMJ13_01080 [halophilic archaeon]|nr:hypothetical protein DMJ13_01080 [halophilic archaeon]